MAKEKSPYEGTFDTRLNGKTCWGRVTSVDTNLKRCRVKTLGLKDHTDDLDLINVQWHSSSAHPQGDEDTTYPRVDQLGIITFMNSEPYISGWFMPPQADGDSPRTTQIPSLQGDKVFSTVGGNSLVMKSGGSCQMNSSLQCYTWWLPADNRWHTTCDNWELETNGGTMTWEIDKISSETTWEFFAWDTFVNPTAAYDIQIGTTDSGALVDMSVSTLDENNDIAIALFNATIQKNGDTDINLGPGKFTLHIEAATGDVIMTTQGNVNQQIQGNVNQTIQGNVSEVVNGNVTQNIKGNVDMTVGGDVDAEISGSANIEAETISLNGDKGPGEEDPFTGITTANSHQQVIDLITGVPVEQSLTVFADI